MSTAGESDQGFFAFFREYTHTGIHAASTAGLTAFGLLTFVHRAFVVLAIAVYVLPPIYLYLTRDDAVDTVESSESSDRPHRDSAAVSTETAESTETTGAAESRGSADTIDSVDSADASRTDDPAEPTEATDSGRATGSSGAADTAATESTTDDRPRASAAGERHGTSGPTGGLDARRSDERNAGTAPETDPEASAETTAGGEGAEKPAAPASTDAGAGVGPDERSETEDVEASTEEPATLEWTEADSPTDETLCDVVATDAGAYAVGTGGVVLAREEGWETVLDHGPSAESNALRGVDATDDGNAVWFAGDGGTLARYDAEAGRHTDHSAPAGITDNWVDVAVAGPAGEEGVYLVNGSGQVLAGEFDGSEAEWGDPTKPGSGSSMSAIEFLEEGVGYCCDTNSGVYETTDGGEFERIGVEDGGSFTALAAAGPEELAVAAADGTVQRYDGSVWTPMHAAEVALDALSTDGTTWLAGGDGGTIRELVDGSWEPRETPIEANLHGVAVGEPSVAVGAEGTILELQPVDGGG